jgi:two-component system OmpR family response regulator
MRVLIVEDDGPTRELLERGLREELFSVEAVADGAAGEARAVATGYDVIVLDVVLPGQDGITVCRRLRIRGVDTPILMLTGRESIQDRVRALDGGADDYLPKPYAFGELVARLRALGRRGRSRHLDAILSFGPIALDQRDRTATVNGRALALSLTELRLLEYLLRRAERVVTRDELIERVWGQEPSAGSKVVDMYISYLRRKLGPAGALVQTIRGLGYMLGGTDR